MDIEWNELKDALRDVLEEELGMGACAIAPRWSGGKMLLVPFDISQKEKEVPLVAFFKKLTSVREKLRVLEQKINNHPGLSAEDKSELQMLITRSYGSLTTFNFLFRDEKDKFVGVKGEEQHMVPVRPEHNIVLIGMPGVGKSTVGVLLAKAISRDFIDTDVHIQSRERRRLQDIINTDGLDAFRTLEEKHLLALDCSGHVIATGGSVVYSDAAMRHLKATGVAVYLGLPLATIEERITNLDSRGVVMAPGQTFAALYEERRPLYERYADVTVDCEGLNHEEVVARLVEMFGE